MKVSISYLPTYCPQASGSEARLYEEILDEVELAESAGFDRVWFAEHHFFAYGGVIPLPALLGMAVAQRTRRIRIGAGVALLPLGDPIRIAEEFALLDVMSGGRLDFGIGRVFQRAEYDGFNVAMDQSRDRFNEAHTSSSRRGIRSASRSKEDFDACAISACCPNRCSDPIRRSSSPASSARNRCFQ